MVKYNVKTFVFSSSATVYGDPVQLPIKEDARIAPQNPYGRTKQYIEALLLDLYASDDSWKIAILRYFNPVGAHATGLIGEKPNGTPNNLMPYITQVAAGELEKLSVFGGDYDTPDGTGIRDYIHVMDLAKGHVNAVEKLDSMKAGKVLTLNLGTGRGYSVLEVIKKFEQVSGQKIPYDIVERRAGDVASCYADPTLARKVLDWKSEFGIDEMCADAWNWQVKQDD
jgi:UDP-glucose 4-epimerase